MKRMPIVAYMLLAMTLALVVAGCAYKPGGVINLGTTTPTTAPTYIQREHLLTAEVQYYYVEQTRVAETALTPLATDVAATATPDFAFSPLATPTRTAIDVRATPEQ